MSANHTHLNKKQNIFLALSLVLGIVLGYADLKPIYDTANFFIQVFINLLQFISLPIIFLSINAAIAKLKDKHAFQNILGKTLTYTLSTTIIAAIVAMMLYQLFDPAAKNIACKASESTHLSDLSKYLLNIIPANIIQIFADNNVMAITAAALLTGVCSLFLEEKPREIVHNIFDGFFALFMEVAKFVVKLIPLVLWAFIVDFIKQINSGFASETIFYYILTISTANFIQAVVILPLFLKTKGISPMATFKGMFPALITAFFSKSSSATMPSTLHCVDNRLKVNPKISAITVPLCTTINMNACAAFIYITVLFVAQSQGITFATADYFTWIFLATLAAIGNAGVPMGCFFMASAYLASMGASTYLMGVILPFYAILDMFETAINVWSDGCVTRIIDKIEQKKPARA
jgi:Na+/H+-dicarboxylate symporter